MTALPSSDTKKPQGKDAVKKALIAASIDLFSERGIKAVPVRDIADLAQVNSALIYRHFGSKEGLIEATVEELFSQLGPMDQASKISGEEMLINSFMSIKRNPKILHVLAHLALEGGSDTFKKVPNTYMDQTLAQIEQEQSDGKLRSNADPRIMLASSFALGLGWHVFRPMLLEIAGLNERNGQQVRDEIDAFWSNAISANSADSNTD